MFKFIKNSLLLVFILNLAACSYSPSALKIVYNGMAEELADELKEPISLSTSQSAIIEDYTKELMQWHRQNKLPEYAKNFADFAQIVQQDNISLPQLKMVLKKVEGMPHFEQATHLTKKIVVVAKTLTTAQIVQLEKALHNESQQEALATKNKNFITEVSNNTKGMFNFIGISLNEEQLSIVREDAKNLHDIRSYQVQATQQWNRQFISVLKQTNRPDFASRFARLWKMKDRNLQGKAHQLDQQNSIIMATLIRKLIMSLDTHQIQRLSQQLNSISTTFREMAYE